MEETESLALLETAEASLQMKKSKPGFVIINSFWRARLLSVEFSSRKSDCLFETASASDNAIY